MKSDLVKKVCSFVKTFKYQVCITQLPFKPRTVWLNSFSGAYISASMSEIPKLSKTILMHSKEHFIKFFGDAWEGYYAKTLLHEYVHATGDILGRKSLLNYGKDKRGKNHSLEEVTVILGMDMLAKMGGVYRETPLFNGCNYYRADVLGLGKKQAKEAVKFLVGGKESL